MPTNNQLKPESESLRDPKEGAVKALDPKSSLYEVLGGCAANGFAMPSIIRKNS